MTTRELPISEHDRLIGSPLEAAIRVPGVRVVVVEDAGVIVGCCGLFMPLHVEGLWIDPSHRSKSAVGRRLWRSVQSMASAVGAKAVLAAIGEDATWCRRWPTSLIPALTRIDLP